MQLERKRESIEMSTSYVKQQLWKKVRPIRLERECRETWMKAERKEVECWIGVSVVGKVKGNMFAALLCRRTSCSSIRAWSEWKAPEKQEGKDKEGSYSTASYEIKNEEGRDAGRTRRKRSRWWALLWLPIEKDESQWGHNNPKRSEDLW